MAPHEPSLRELRRNDPRPEPKAARQAREPSAARPTTPPQRKQPRGFPSQSAYRLLTHLVKQLGAETPIRIARSWRGPLERESAAPAERP